MNTQLSSLNVAAIRNLVDPPDRTVSVYLGRRPATVDPDLRIRQVERMLSSRGADDTTTATVLTEVGRLTNEAAGCAVLAADGRIRLAHPTPAVVRADRVRVGAPAHVLPLVAWLQRHPAYLTVVVDHLGAELTVVPAGFGTPTTTVIVGPDDEIECNAPGGLSQPRYQRRAIDSWQHNAAAVADAVTHALRTVPARLLLIAGDVRASHLLREHLPPQIRREVTLRRLPGGRHPDGSAHARTAAVDAAVTGYVAEQDAVLLRELAERNPAATVRGVAATLPALARGRLATLFLDDEDSDDRTAWYSADVLCSPVAIRGGARGPLADVAARAALLTHAEIRVLDAADGPAGGISGPADGIGGLCRYPAG
jgi:hypothetical protein